MIRQSPNVPAAVELADLARHIMNTEFTFQDATYNYAWHWQSPNDFDPHLTILVDDVDAIKRRGRMLFSFATLGIVERSMEYFLEVPVTGASNIRNDLYVEDFMQTFRQYQHGRTELIIPN